MADKPSVLTRVEWPFPIYGVNTELDARHLPPEALASCTNMYYAQPYLLRTRGGIDATYTGGSDVVCMYYWDFDGQLYRADDTKHLYANNNLKATGAENIVDMCSFGVGASPLLIVAENETANPSLHTWNGAVYAVLAGTSIPRARLVMSRFGRLFGTRSAQYPSRVFWSDVGDATLWLGAFNEGGWLDVAPGQDGVIEDWIDYGGILYIFKEYGVYRMVGDTPATFAAQKLTDTDQVLRGTVHDCGKGVLYSTKYGVFPVGAARQAESYDVTRNIERTFQTFVASKAQAAYSPEMNAYVVVNGSKTVWLANLNNRPDVWTSFSAPTFMSSVYQGNGLWFGGTNGAVYKYDHDGFTDGVTAFSCSFKTGDWNFGDERMEKNIRWLEGYLNATQTATATISLYKDGAGAATAAQPMHLGALATGARPLVEYNFNCKTCALGVVYTALTAPAAFGGAVLQIRPTFAED